MIGEGEGVSTEGPIRIGKAIMLWLIMLEKGLARTLGTERSVDGRAVGKVAKPRRIRNIVCDEGKQLVCPERGSRVRFPLERNNLGDVHRLHMEGAHE